MNVKFERAKFDHECQKDNDTLEKCIMVLYSSMETCNYGDLKNDMPYDRAIVGLRHSGDYSPL